MTPVDIQHICQSWNSNRTITIQLVVHNVETCGLWSISLPYSSAFVMTYLVDQIGAASTVHHAKPDSSIDFTCHPIGEPSRLSWWRRGRVDICISCM